MISRRVRAAQRVAGRGGQIYNQRRNRKGAYWEDRYHATAVETGEHLKLCLVYIDLNMVRAGVVVHPRHWPDCGYVEIQKANARYRIIDFEQLMDFMGVESLPQLQEACRMRVEAALGKRTLVRQSHWTESIVVAARRVLRLSRNNWGLGAKGERSSRLKEDIS